VNNLFVFCELDEGKPVDVSLELLTKGRTLANTLGCRLEAVVLGSGIGGIENELFPYGVDVACGR
jgi:electron transfer flavoprotein alpha subunit